MQAAGSFVEGKLIVLTAPLTETIDHAGYFIQMALASLPKRMEGIINQKYPKWRELERNDDGSARYMPAGVRLVEALHCLGVSRRGPGLLLSRGSAAVRRVADTSDRCLDAQSFGSDLCGRRVRFHFWLLAGTD